jgi:HAD superfamily hydrolase (TIGR01509 family)
MFKFFLFMSFFSSTQASSPVESKKEMHILFDFGDVVIHKDKDFILNFLMEQFNIDHISAQTLVEEYGQHRVRGGDAFDFFFDYCQKNHKVLPENFIGHFQNKMDAAIVLDEKVFALIKQIQNEGGHVHLFSNTDAYKAQNYQKLGLYDPFEKKFLSYNFGLKKPQQQFYEAVVDELKCAPQQCVFIDNKLSNIAVAEQLGWCGIHYKNADQLQAELEQIGIIQKHEF